MPAATLAYFFPGAHSSPKKKAEGYAWAALELDPNCAESYLVAATALLRQV